MKSFVLPIVLFLSTAAVHAEEKRQLGAHEHGHGALNVALEGKRVTMELKVPGVDIVGFEHEATTAKQKDAVAAAKKRLAAPLSLFVPDAAAQCKLASSKVELEHGEHEHDHGHKNEKDAHDHKKGDEHGEEHAEFHAEYVLECGALNKLQKFTAAFFKSFPGSKELEVQVLGPKGQKKAEVTPKSPVIDLKGVH